ncbi:WD40 repeat domain-containing protein [Streptomyces sp. NPDC006798]|uniref:WD40 repeat domain-containing protein n=1 Tax=Streptomyces sp. NPDC006798 TaxID=3155462 RepID=UPI0033D9CA3A
MGRREKPLDPADGPVQSFASDLRALRRAAGSPTYRSMAQGSAYSAPSLSGAASGERLPSLPVTLAYVAACGGDLDEWRRRWQRALADEPVVAVDDGTTAPYPGLARYGTDDSDHFFGREDLVADLLELTRRYPVAALVGASGSGKSSLLRAGLVPALRGATPVTEAADAGTELGTAPSVIRILTPGPTPARTHRSLITSGAFLIVDQFEEVFTLCRDRAERNAFLELLTGSGCRVVIAVRADFSGRCAEHPALAAALKESVLLVGPMTPEQLRAAVVGPATAGRLIVERALTARIVADVADEPGGLPLMSHALLETWRRRRGRTLTEAAYEAIGGVQGAVAHTAEEAFGSFTEHEARAGRELLLRLISPGDTTEDTRRTARRGELLHGPESERVLERLVRARLLTVDDGAVDLAHEALIRGWPRLRGWIEEDRDRLRLHRALTDAARTWDRLGRDEGALYRGAQLAAAREAFGTPPDEPVTPAAGRSIGHRAARRVRRSRLLAARRTRAGLTRVPRRDAASPVLLGTQTVLTPQEHDFLTASYRAHDDALRAAVRATRRLRALTATLSVLLCLATIAGLSLWKESRAGDRRAVQAEARQLAETANTLRESDPGYALSLSLAAWRKADTPETREALFTAAAQSDSAVYRLETEHADLSEVRRDISADGRSLITLAPESSDSYGLGRHTTDRSGAGLGGKLKRLVAIAPHHRAVALGTDDGIRMWNLSSATFAGPVFGPRAGGTRGWFAPWGEALATRTPDGPLEVWDPTTGRELLDTGDRRPLSDDVHISPGARLLAYCAAGGALQIWDIGTRRKLPTPWTDRVDGGCGAGGFRFTPDGRALAFATASGVLTIEVRTGRERPRIVTDGLPQLAFSSDGAHLATLTPTTLQVWRTALPHVPVLHLPVSGINRSDLRLDMAESAVRFREGEAPSAIVRTIEVNTPEPRAGEDPPISAAAFSQDAEVLATARSRMYEIRDGDGRLRQGIPSTGECAGLCGPLMALHPSGEVLALLDASDRVVVHDLGPRLPGSPDRSWTAERHPAQYALPPLPGVTGMAFSTAGPSGDTLGVSASTPRRHVFASADYNDARYGYIWSRTRENHHGTILAGARGDLITDRRRIVSTEQNDVPTLMHGEGQAVSAAFSPEKHFTAMADADGRVTLWGDHGERNLAVLAPGNPAAPGSRSERPVALAFSPDGTTLAVGDSRGRIQLWDTARLRSLPLPPADGPVLALAFTADGSRLRVATPHTASRAYPLDPTAVADSLCRRINNLPSFALRQQDSISDPDHQQCAPTP